MSATKDRGGVYLLVKESPEHGQRDVEEHHLQNHLDLRDQKFLQPIREEDSAFIFRG